MRALKIDLIKRQSAWLTITTILEYAKSKVETDQIKSRSIQQKIKVPDTLSFNKQEREII